MKTIAASIASFLLLAGCSAADGMSGSGETATAAQSGEVAGVRDGETRLSVGQTLAIDLPSNSTTGYSWQVSDVEGGVLSPAMLFGEEISDPHAPGMVGIGGTTHWHYTAAKAGSVTLTFRYGRAWETDAAPAETATYRVVVR